MKPVLLFVGTLLWSLTLNTQGPTTAFDTRPGIKKGYAKVNGTSLYYEVSGKGTPIVFIHGNFGDRRHWDRQFGTLSKKYKVIRYDVRGFGKSSLPKLDEPYSNHDDLKALLDFLEIKKAHICGLSMGSGTAVDFAIIYPEMCYSLIAVGPWVSGYGWGKFKTPNADSMFAVFTNATRILQDQGQKQCTDFIWKGNNCLARSVKNPSTLNALLEMGYEYSFWSLFNRSPVTYPRPAAITRLKDIKLPTLIVRGEYDVEACIEVAEMMEKEIVGARKVCMQGAGHIMNMDKPTEFNKLVSDFITGIK